MLRDAVQSRIFAALKNNRREEKCVCNVYQNCYLLYFNGLVKLLPIIYFFIHHIFDL